MSGRSGHPHRRLTTSWSKVTEMAMKAGIAIASAIPKSRWNYWVRMVYGVAMWVRPRFALKITDFRMGIAGLFRRLVA